MKCSENIFFKSAQRSYRTQRCSTAALSRGPVLLEKSLYTQSRWHTITFVDFRDQDARGPSLDKRHGFTKTVEKMKVEEESVLYWSRIQNTRPADIGRTPTTKQWLSSDLNWSKCANQEQACRRWSVRGPGRDLGEEAKGNKKADREVPFHRL